MNLFIITLIAKHSDADMAKRISTYPIHAYNMRLHGMHNTYRDFKAFTNRLIFTDLRTCQDTSIWTYDNNRMF